MIFLRTEIKTELRCNVYDDIIAEEECCVWCRAERYLLIIILNLILFWSANFLQTDYALKTVFYDVNDAVIVIK